MRAATGTGRRVGARWWDATSAPVGTSDVPYAAQPCRAVIGNLARRTRHHGRVPEVDDDQLAALRRLRAAFGPIEVVEVISNDPARGRAS
jgi:hypothetical protein